MADAQSQEAAVLHAAIEEDKPRLHELLSRFSGPELVIFYNQLGLLIDLVTIEYQQRGPHAPGRELGGQG